MTKKKASELVKYYYNENGPTIGVTVKDVINIDGLYFKDINGDGKLNVYKDWRNSSDERAKALAAELSVDEKIGLIFVNSWNMGIYQESKEHVDETGLLDEKHVQKGESIFSVESTYGTTHTLKEWGVRHLILRTNPKPDDLVHWINQLNLVAEECKHAIPVLVVSNSRNEHGEAVFGMNDATGVFATWPGTMGIAAAIKGSDVSLIDDFAQCIRKEWDAVGMKKGYMYMADVMSDPRWQRTYGTFGEDPELIHQIFERLIPGIQGSDNGLTTDGVALTIKHFPGGGARENGFDPHYAEGQWNVYQTEGSLSKYHLPTFTVAIDKNAASIMPYYAKPAALKSKPQVDLNGNEVEMTPVGFAYNKYFLEDLLRKQMGFKGYINSDSGITSKMAWGVEDLDEPERIALAINVGVDIISGALAVVNAKEAYERGKNGYYTTQGHKVPDGYTVEDVTLSEEALTRAVERTLKEMFDLGIFDNPYRDADKAVEVVKTQAHWDAAQDVHRKSVVLLKNEENLLPLTSDKLAGKKVYVEGFKKTAEDAEKFTAELVKELTEKFSLNLTNDYNEADYAILFVNPSSGEYFNSTKGYLELDICNNKTVVDVDSEGRPADTTHEETTLANAEKLYDIYKTVKSNGGKVISNINFTLAWIVGNVEKNCDALLAGFDTYTSATMDIILGNYNPVGKMPITLPKNDSVIAVNKDGVCISPNDVPGYDKDKFMPESMKDENGKAYAYRDKCGNYYELNFGLSYK